MVADYTDIDAVMTLLRSSPTAGVSTDDTDRVELLIPFVSLEITRATGVEFGVAPTSESLYIEDAIGNTMMLPRRLRTLTSIIENPTWNGTTWADGFTLATDTYRMGPNDRHGLVRTLIRHNQFWFGNYLVTGVWGDQPLSADIPADITYIATYITAELYKKQAANPAGMQGPNGYTLPIRNSFKEPEVKSVLHAYCTEPWVYVV